MTIAVSLWVPPMRRRDGSRGGDHMAISTARRPISRRSGPQGAGPRCGARRRRRRSSQRAAGGAATAARRQRRLAAPRRRRRRASQPRGHRHVTFGSNYSDAVPKARHARRWSTTSRRKTGIAVNVNTVDHGTFQDQISAYLQGTPDDIVHLVRRLPDAVLRRPGPRDDIDDVWATVGAQLLRRLQGRLHRRRRQAVLRPVLQLPVGRHLPQEPVRRRRATRSPRRRTSSRPSATR